MNSCCRREHRVLAVSRISSLDIRLISPVTEVANVDRLMSLRNITELTEK